MNETFLQVLEILAIGMVVVALAAAVKQSHR